MTLSPCDDFRPPAQVDEYKVIELIGRGAMGQVYLGHDTNLERRVAIKFIAPLRPGSALRERFIVEARAIARLLHPNVVAIYRVGTVDGLPYLVYEFVQGRSLSEIEKPLPWRRALKIAVDLTKGLAEAHQRGVLHRDIKPANVLLSDRDEVKLLDFGLAKLLQESGVHTANWRPRARQLRTPKPPASDLAETQSFEETGPHAVCAPQVPQPSDAPVVAATEITDPGARLGTPLYMAPEIWRGEAGTERSDIYSLGALLYELCCGRPPHWAQTSTELASLVVSSDAAPIEDQVDDIPVLLAIAINACVRRSPEDRPSSAMALCQMLESVAAQGEPVAIPEGNPYRGLRPFEAADRELLFGRAQDIRAVVEQLRTDPLVLVTGDSGVGKSSLCRAGVLPQIREGALKDVRRWSVAVLSPGRWLLDTLGDALAPHLAMPHTDLVLGLRKEPGMLAVALSERLGKSHGLLLFIDQMEELVTQSAPAEVARMGELLSHLCQRLPGVRVLAAVRGDFLTRLAERTRLSYELSRALYLLRPLQAPELREVIEGPAKMKGVAFESEEMVQSIVTSTLDAQGGLPLLQFTLAQLWEMRDVERRVICSDSLSQLGGVAGSLARYADGVYERLLPEQKVAAERLLTRLVRMDGTRTSRREEELLSTDPSDRATLDALVRARLVVARRLGIKINAYELAHESLLTGWKRLSDWLGHAQERRAAQERAEVAAAEWSRLGKPNELLWQSLQLLEVQKHEVVSLVSSPHIPEFLTASHRHVVRWRRIRYTLGGLVLLTVVSLGAGAVWYWQQRKEVKKSQAEQIRIKAHQAGRENQALQEAMQFMADEYRGKKTPALVDQTLHSVLMASGPDVPALQHKGTVRWVEYSPDGLQVVSASDDGCAYLWSTADGKKAHKLSGHSGPVVMARFAKDGASIVTASSDGTARVWDSKAGSFRWMLKGHSGAVNAAAYSPDGQLIVTAGEDETALLWDAKTGAQRFILAGHHGAVRAATFSPDGQHVVTASADGAARIFSVATGALIHTFKGHQGAVLVVNYSPSGQQVVTGGEDKTGKVWDTQTGELIATLIDHRSPLVAAEFSADGTRILTAASMDVAARLWNAEKGVRLATLSGHMSELHWATFSADSSRIATMGTDHVVRLWHGETGVPLGSYGGHRSEVLHAAFAPDSRHLITASKDQTAQIWVEQLGSVTVLPLHQGPVWAGSFSPNGMLIATTSGDYKVRLWDAQSKTMLAKLEGHNKAVLAGVFSPNSKWLATTSFDEKENVILWNVTERKQQLTLSGHTMRVDKAYFSRTGDRLLTVSYDRTARLWSVPEGRLLHTLKGHSDAVYSGGFSADGKQVITASADKTARVWSAETGVLQFVLGGHDGPVWVATFSPDGQQIVTAGEDRVARLWSASSGLLQHKLEGHTDWVLSASFSPDSRTVVTGSLDGTGRGWDIKSGVLRYELRGHGEGVVDVQFDLDGERLVTASTDHTAQLWDAKSGEPIGVFQGHVGPVIFASFSPDGAAVLTGSTDQTARIYPSQRDQWTRQSCAHLARWSGYMVGLETLCKDR
jgi:WD40 repeat protein/serine/threonine protein kinase